MSNLRLDHFSSAAAYHVCGRVGPRARNNGWHDRSVRHPQASQSVDPKLAVHDGIGVGANFAVPTAWPKLPDATRAKSIMS